jgi:hypothetical protein
MPVPGPMRMQGWEGSLGSWKPLALKGDRGGKPQSSEPLGWTFIQNADWGQDARRGGGVGVEQDRLKADSQSRWTVSCALSRHTSPHPGVLL